MIFIIFFSLVFITTFALWKYVRLKHDVYEYTEKLDGNGTKISVAVSDSIFRLSAGKYKV